MAHIYRVSTDTCLVYSKERENQKSTDFGVLKPGCFARLIATKVVRGELYKLILQFPINMYLEISVFPGTYGVAIFHRIFFFLTLFWTSSDREMKFGRFTLSTTHILSWVMSFQNCPVTTPSVLLLNYTLLGKKMFLLNIDLFVSLSTYWERGFSKTVAVGRGILIRTWHLPSDVEVRWTKVGLMTNPSSDHNDKTLKITFLPNCTVFDIVDTTVLSRCFC